MITEELKKQLIKDNPLIKECPECGNRAKIYGAAVREGDINHKEHFIIFGSDADFCTKCDEPW